MAGQFTVVVAVVALVAARLGLGTARPAADFEPPHRLFGGASLRVVNQARDQTHAGLSSALVLQNPIAMVTGIVGDLSEPAGSGSCQNLINTYARR